MNRILVVVAITVTFGLAIVIVGLSGVGMNTSHSGNGGRGGPCCGGAAPTPPSTQQNLYTCSMHPDVRLAQPGTCPRCGMQLVPVQ